MKIIVPDDEFEGVFNAVQDVLNDLLDDQEISAYDLIDGRESD